MYLGFRELSKSKRVHKHQFYIEIQWKFEWKTLSCHLCFGNLSLNFYNDSKMHISLLTFISSDLSQFIPKFNCISHKSGAPLASSVKNIYFQKYCKFPA